MCPKYGGNIIQPARALELVQIIEDEPEQARLLDYAFQKAGYLTSIAYDGLSGLDAVRRLKPSLVVLDLMLPELDGYGVCRQLRKYSETRDIPILMVTALTENMHRVIAQTLGADDLVLKPFGIKDIVQRGTHLIQRRGAGAIATNHHSALEYF